ncbi:MAG: homoserine dehydrogenase [Phycisphaerales bacterium]|nr:homoserine dehydrogenase [Phycisphaerales bacterium]
MRIVLVGFGSVGRAFASMLANRCDSLYSAFGLSPRLVAVIDSRGAAASSSGGGLDPAALLAAKQGSGSVGGLPSGGLGDVGSDEAAALIRDLAADVVIEASPSDLKNPGPALANLKAAFSSGKHAISVNKAPLALAMPALTELARFNRVEFRYSGTVGAGTPVLDTARKLAQGDRITRVRAILNGTTNYILWRMKEVGIDYAAALAEAQKLGYAESDPANDVDGIDTATKVVILANAILGNGPAAFRPTISEVSISGIRGIGKDRIDSAAAGGCVVKLIGEIDAAARTLRVSPQEVPAAGAGGALDVPRNINAVQFTLESAGEVSLIGRGAGGPETATAIIRDLVDIWNAPAGGAHDR